MRNYCPFVVAFSLLIATNVSAQQKSSSAPLTKENAGKIIEMTNVVVDIYNDQISEIRDVWDCLERFDNSIDAVAKNPNASAHGASCANIKSLPSTSVDKLKTNAKSAPAFAEKAAILEGIDKLNEEFETAKLRCQEIQKYLSEKKYKEDDDNFSNYVALRDSYYDSYKTITNLFDEVMDLSSAAGDRAEIVILKTHPLASVVIPMKNNLSAVSKLISKCRADNPDAAAIKADQAAIQKMLEKDKVMTTAIKAALKKANNGEDRFERFYTYEGDAMTWVDTFLEYLDPSKEITDVDHILDETVEEARDRHLKKYYDEIRKYYRYMVGEYNDL